MTTWLTDDVSDDDVSDDEVSDDDVFESRCLMTCLTTCLMTTWLTTTNVADDDSDGDGDSGPKDSLNTSLTVDPPADSSPDLRADLATSEVQCNPISARITISGKRYAGQWLEVAVANAAHDEDGIVYQWQRSSDSGFTDISGATGTTTSGASDLSATSYSLDGADIGHQIRVHITYTNTSTQTVSGCSEPTATIATTWRSVCDRSASVKFSIYGKLDLWGGFNYRTESVSEFIAGHATVIAMRICWRSKR